MSGIKERNMVIFIPVREERNQVTEIKESFPREELHCKDRSLEMSGQKIHPAVSYRSGHNCPNSSYWPKQRGKRHLTSQIATWGWGLTEIFPLPFRLYSLEQTSAPPCWQEVKGGPVKMHLHQRNHLSFHSADNCWLTIWPCPKLLPLSEGIIQLLTLCSILAWSTVKI